SASHFACRTSGSAACAAANRPKQQMVNAANKVLFSISLPLPAGRFEIYPDKQQHGPGAHQADAPEFRDLWLTRQVERGKHERKAGEAQRIHAEQKVLNQHLHCARLYAVMPGLVPGIHDFVSWMAGPRPAMTDEERPPTFECTFAPGFDVGSGQIALLPHSSQSQSGADRGH